MLQDLIRRLAGPPARDPLTPEDARLAMAALMVRISRTDGSYSEAERRRIDAMLMERYRLDAGGGGAGRGPRRRSPRPARRTRCSSPG